MTGEEPATEPWKANTKRKSYRLELREEFLNKIEINKKKYKWANI